MTAIKVLHLPWRTNLRAFVERALEFLQQVYKDEVLEGLQFIAYTFLDEVEEEVVKKKFGVRVGLRAGYYQYTTFKAVVAVSRWWPAIEVFDVIVEEVSHHALRWVHNKKMAIEALLQDIPRLREIDIKRADIKDRARVSTFVEELYVKYIVHDYFLKLKDRPVTEPWAHRPLGGHITSIHEFAVKWEKGIILDVVKIVYDEVIQKRNPLPNFRRAVHDIFTGAVKKLPVEVYNSNPSRYEVLYREQLMIDLEL